MSSFFWADKPAGLTTHTSLNAGDRRPWTDVHDGYMEWLSARLGHPLFPVHRLDRETTGIIAFAKDREAAAQALELFESRDVSKEYLFITDRKPRQASDASAGFEVKSHIERDGNEYVSRHTGEANAHTTFEHVQSQGRFSLWRARPLTGKPHQIRLHAEDSGLAILGDAIHGGTEFAALCLHAHKITLAGESHEAPPPTYFDDLRLLSDTRLVRWLAACDRRERINRTLAKAQIAPSPTHRLIHTEGHPLRLETLGDVASLNWFRETYPTEQEWASITKLLELKNLKTWALQIRTDRGKDPITDRTLTSEPPPPERWIAQENGINFEFRRETGLSPGLFLDQRANRKWIEETSRGERVLNLFCYTGGFSVAAAKGGAAQVISVDVSKPFLEWSKRNFEINQLPIVPHEFRAIDSGEYLAWAAKKGLSFDTVICDPPSFARTNTRGKSKVFRIDQEFAQLIQACAKVATRRILFSTNFEQWTLDEFAQAALKALPGKKIVAPPPADLDFEMPRQLRHMKALVIEL